MADQEAAAPPPENVSPNLQHPADVLHTVNLVSQLLAAVLILSLGYNAAAFVDGYYGGGFHIYEISKGNFKGYKKVFLSVCLKSKDMFD
ncbi:hypothetical protein C8035_v006201 [Colletotrichum spinosum]|uniref:Uncharacterized protein n=1 Tax=Colletotrichum spinosum TaxID=1347390 RepID=A0A4R8Q722_9PEZI|nr:hypothetical protein C8035_v006201 [Colletotrichum spinosum]